MRPLSEADEAFYCALYGDPDTMRFIGPPLERERAQLKFHKVLASLDRQPVVRVMLAIVETASRRCIGIGALQDFDHARRRVEVGMMLVREGRSRGFGTDGLRALVNYAFATFAVDEVWLQHDVNSAAGGGPPASLGLLQSPAPQPGKTMWSAHRHSWPAEFVSVETTGV
jgi:RimJ/RimL family protein N-acetyltransferase